ncbi:ATP-dependent DNA helicase [Dacryopinax primogenitus]|uniref:ATP-dependent DNA helicase n=1 Tax=Dacryopinax primogenitus (strain DJM 731) TaxID=1858805 RepID=M5G4R7_DACPD|nr:ATP-dependent DNA helicase [Dacryopinax primogenitus]EJT98732.1 ATP-dependent DNA helicase [Dacryopinax primogenitus]
MALEVPNWPIFRNSRTPIRSSSSQTPTNDDADIVIEGQLLKPRRLRRTASGLVDCHRVLTHTFGYTAYKGRQKEIVEAAVRGADVLVVAPTGMGKSLCFQIPAIADQFGVSIVVSPLLALMSNQVTTLREKGVNVASLCSDTSQAEKSRITKDLSSGHPRIRLLYITPEKLASAEFSKLMMKVYDNRQVMRLIVDEAHCITEWGWDFRPEYRTLGNFRQKYPEVPIMALTASATAAVQDDIVSSLKMSSEHLLRVVHPFNRKNLFYEIKFVANTEPHLIMQDLVDYILKLTERRGRASCGIIYCRARAACDQVAGFLRRKGITAKPYHRGVSPKVLATTLQEWLDDKVEVVVATVAFGMGIDKPDVRYILHYDLPKSFEGYYQETGRAGRDGSASKCILYYSIEDARRAMFLVQQDLQKRIKGANKTATPSQRAPKSLELLIRMAENIKTCRHVSICRYFGESIDDKDRDVLKTYCDKMCDVCKHPEKVRQRIQDLASDEHIAFASPPLDQDVEAEDEEPVCIKQETQGRLQNLWSRSLRDELEDSAEEQDESSEGEGTIKEIVTYQPKLLQFPKKFKPPTAGSSSGASAPRSLLGRVDLAGATKPTSAPAPTPAQKNSTLQTNDPPNTVLEIMGDPPGQPGLIQALPRRLSDASRPPEEPSAAEPPNRRSKVNGKRPLSETEVNAPEDGPKHPRNNLADIIRNGPTKSTRPWVRHASKPMFKSPFVKPQADKNQPMDPPPPNPLSGITDHAKDGDDSTGTKPTSEDMLVIPSQKTSDHNIGRTTVLPTQDKGKRAREIALPRSIGQPLQSVDPTSEERWNNAPDVLVFALKVEVPHWNKIPHQSRDSAATAIVRLLGSAMLQYSRRDELWQRVGLPNADRELKRDILQQCAKEIEFDMVNLAATPEGYKSSLQSRETGIKMMRDVSSAAWRDGPERDPDTLEARAAVTILRNICKNRAKHVHSAT